jgi:hypothetical protein
MGYVFTVAGMDELLMRMVGRRRPTIIIGSLSVVVALLVLGWAREIVGVFIPSGDAVSYLEGERRGKEAERWNRRLLLR